MKKHYKIFPVGKITFFVLFFLLYSLIYSQTYIPVTNYHNGISIGFQGTAGTDYIFDRYYYDPLVNDCGLCYIKSDVPITLAHNANNSRISKTSTIITGGDLGDIRYKVDQDFIQGIHWAGDDGDRAWGCEVFPAYSNPVAFDDMEYPKTGEPVVGNTGFSTTNFSDRENLFAKGLLDEVGNEYHYFTYADDDDNNITAGYQLEYGASDGKSMLFCVNPKTPAIWLNTASSGAEYYTTPAKIYFIPKIHEQISYVTNDVNINLKNIMNSNTVYYRFDGGSYQIYSGAISSNTLSDGSHILEFYYDPSYVQSRTIVKNPDHPCKQDVFEDGSGHGYLLWRDDNEFQRDRDRALTGYFASTYQSYKTDCDQYLGFTGNNGVRNVPLGKSAFSYAMIAMFEGVANNLDYMEAAKTRLLNNRRMHIENIGFELNWSNAPNPCHEITFRGYVNDRNLYSNAFTYDLIAKYYRSDQYANGITPIQDLRIRDMLAVPAMEGLMIMGDFNTSYDLEVEMWPIAQTNAAVMAALAMPSYNTNYLGTSGFDGVQATHTWTPYPDYPSSWKDAYLIYTDEDIQGHQATLHSFPNKKTMFNWFSGNDNSILKADGNWHGRVPYASTDMMGHGFEFFYNVMKRKFNKSYPTIDLFIEKSIIGTLEGDRFEVPSDYGAHAYPRRCMANEYFPDHAPVAVDANDTDGKYFDRTSPYFYFLHNPDWASASICESTVPPTSPTNLNGTAGETSISLTWSGSTHTECGVAGYKVIRDGNHIVTVPGTQYFDPGLTRGTTYEYKIVALSFSDVPSAESTPVQFTTLTDDILPTIANVYTTINNNELFVEFSEVMNLSTIENISNYSVDNGIAVSDAQIQFDNKTVLLTVTGLSNYVTYTLTVNNVQDAFGGNAILPNSTATFEYTNTTVPFNVALDKPVTCSSESSAPAANIVDGDTSDGSRWATTNFPQWVEIDLGADYDMSSFELYTYQGRDYQYTIDVSTDGVNFTQAVDRSQNVEHSPIIDNYSVVGRYIRLSVSGATTYTGTWVSINELEIYGLPVNTFVPIPVNGVSVSPTILNLNIGDTHNLVETVEPVDATNQNVAWNSSDTSVATVDASGIVTAIAAGIATISVTTEENNFSDNCNVTVIPNTGSGTNLALGKLVTVSYEPQSYNPGANIVDDNTSDDSRWSTSGFPQWAIIDLGVNCNINRFEVYTYYDRDYQYIIEVSEDGTNYTTVVDRSDNTDGSGEIIDNIADVTGRYVKLTFLDAYSYTGSWISINEVKVFGYEKVRVDRVSVSPISLILDEGETMQLQETVFPLNADDVSVVWTSNNSLVADVDANGVVSAQSVGQAIITVTTNDGGYTATCNVTVNSLAVPVNLALGKSVSVTDSYNSGTSGDKLVDGLADDSHKWIAVGMPQSAEIDLGEVCSLTEFKLYTYQSRAYQYIIEVSNDGVNYSTVVDRSANTDGNQPITDAVNCSARYVKLTVTGASGYTGSFVSINELEVYGTTGSKSLPAKKTVSSTLNEVSLILYPNPAKGGQFNIRLTGIEQGRTAMLKIIDVAGNILFAKENISAECKNSVAELSVNTYLPVGMYIVKVESNKSSVYNKLIIK